MSSLLGVMSVAMSGLEAQQAGLETTSNNIANLNTPGYTREQPIPQESDPIIDNGIAYGQGVKLQDIESLRDSILQLQINNETQQQG
jgi:flagellar hook-associated protein 1 FlgK